MLVKVHMEAGREADALAVAREIQKQRPKQSVGYVLEGDINVAKKSWPQAIAAYRTGLKNAGTDDLVIRLDAVLRYSGNAAEADKTLAAWLRDHPDHRDIRMYLAETALGKKDWAVAAARYKEVVAVKPDDALALNNLAYVASQMKDPKALEYAERAVKLAPRNASVLDTYGMLLVDKGDSKRGVETMQRAMELAPASNAIRLNYARALIKDGQKPAAKKELETLAKLGDRFSEQAEVAKLMQGL
jgi:putative PEP-CTERM system TPR-repeat lipoprotein